MDLQGKFTASQRESSGGNDFGSASLILLFNRSVHTSVKL